jgi:hypothetical protein
MVVGLFVEGSRHTDPLRDDFTRLWDRLATRCELAVHLKVFPITKEQITRLVPPARARATDLAKGATRGTGSVEPLDVLLARMHGREELDRVVIAFDRKPANQYLSPEEAALRCIKRAEVRFVLRFLADSQHLAPVLRNSSMRLLERYDSNGELTSRPRASEPIEILFMDPEFEALFICDESTVKRALAVTSRPQGWPTFKIKHRNADLKLILDQAVDCVTRSHGGYSKAKATWGRKFVEAATPDADLWNHPIASRLCRLLAA